MSAKTNKNGRLADTDFSALDRELAQMAQETPEVPADFHAKWVGAIREEAAARHEAEAVPQEPAENRKTVFRQQSRYLLSAAAAFIILIGGVVIGMNLPKNTGRDTNQSSGTPVGSMPDANVSADAAAGEAMTFAGETEYSYEAAGYSMAAEAETAYEMETVAEEAPAYEMEVAAEAGSAGEASYAAYVGAESNSSAAALSAAMPDSAGESAYAPAAGTAVKANASREKAAAEDFADMEEAEEAFDMAEEYAEEAADMEAPVPATEAPVPAATGAPTPEATPEITPAPTDTPTAAPAATEETAPAKEQDAEEPETEMESHSFLQSIWTFILTITPWLLGATIVILFIAAYVINIEKRRERKNK